MSSCHVCLLEYQTICSGVPYESRNRVQNYPTCSIATEILEASSLTHRTPQAACGAHQKQSVADHVNKNASCLQAPFPSETSTSCAPSRPHSGTSNFTPNPQHTKTKMITAKHTSEPLKMKADEELLKIKQELAESKKMLQIELAHLDNKYNFLENLVRNRKPASVHWTGSQIQHSDYSVLLPKAITVERIVQNPFDEQPEDLDQSVYSINNSNNNTTTAPPYRTPDALNLAPPHGLVALDLSQTIDADRLAEDFIPLSTIGTTIDVRSSPSCADAAFYTQSQPEHYKTTSTSHSKKNVPTQTNASSLPRSFNSIDQNKNLTLLGLWMGLHSNMQMLNQIGATLQHAQLIRFVPQRIGSLTTNSIQYFLLVGFGSMQPLEIYSTPVRSTPDTVFMKFCMPIDNGQLCGLELTPGTCNMKIGFDCKKPEWFSTSELRTERKISQWKLMNRKHVVRQGFHRPDQPIPAKYRRLKSTSTWDPGRSARTK